MTPDKVKKVVELIDLPSDSWASVHNIISGCEEDRAELYDSPKDLLDEIEHQLNSLIDEAVDVLSNLREKRSEIIKAVAN